MTTLVRGFGPKNAKIVIVGEAPGAEEVYERKPFVGSSGRLLTSMLNNSGIDRSTCRLENVMQTRPKNNDFGRFYQDPKRIMPTIELLEGRFRLLRDLKQINPNVVIALGREALKALTSRTSIGAWRGSIIESDVGKVVPTFHPAGILRKYENRAIAEMDFRRALLESKTPKLELPEIQSIFCTSFDNACETLIQLKCAPKLSFDIETVGRHVRCIALSDKPWRAFCIPFISKRARSSGTFVSFKDSGHTSHWTLHEEMVILKLLNDVLDGTPGRLIAQNFPFDATILGTDFGIDCQGLWIDTMLLHHACYCEFPKSLDFQCSMYTRVPRYSDYDASSDESTWRYNCYDAGVTHICALKQEQEAKELGVWDLYHSLIQPEMIELTRMQNRGVLIDIELRAKLAAEQMLRMAQALSEMKQKSGLELNPASPKQVGEYLYDKLKIPKKYHKKTGTITVQEEALKSIAARFPQHKESIWQILEYRKAQKLLGTFLTSKLSKGLENESIKLSDGRRATRCVIKTSYQTAGTTSGRISSQKTLFDEGGNLQNIPKTSIRKMLRARDGKVFIVADLSQAEFRVVVWQARCRKIIELYSENPRFDIHCWNAANINGCSVEGVTPLMRNASKAIVHGGNYSLGIQKAVSIATGWGIEITYAEMKRGKEIYHEQMPEIRNVFWKEIEQELHRTRTLVTVFGRRRMFMGRLDNQTYRSAYSFIPQSTVGDIVNRAIGLAEYEMPSGNFPVLQVHDEIVFEVEEARLRNMIQVVRKLMTTELKFPGVPEPLVIPVDIKVGKNWYDTKEVKS